MKYKLLLISSLAVLAFGCAPPPKEESSATGTVTNETPTESGEKRATATLESKSGSNMTGTATFTERSGQVTLVVEVQGATPGEHGIHLHEKGDCSAPDASSAGAHWNPTDEPHGKMGDTPAAHSGDMGNLMVGGDGTGRLEFTTDRWSIGGDSNKDILNKAIVVHAKADDLKTQPSGDSGDRIGCGVIRQ